MNQFLITLICCFLLLFCFEKLNFLILSFTIFHVSTCNTNRGCFDKNMFPRTESPWALPITSCCFNKIPVWRLIKTLIIIKEWLQTIQSPSWRARFNKSTNTTRVFQLFDIFLLQSGCWNSHIFSWKSIIRKIYAYFKFAVYTRNVY